MCHIYKLIPNTFLYKSTNTSLEMADTTPIPVIMVITCYGSNKPAPELYPLKDFPATLMSSILKNPREGNWFNVATDDEGLELEKIMIRDVDFMKPFPDKYKLMMTVCYFCG